MRGTALLMIGDVTVLEGNAGTHKAVVPVMLTEPHGNSVTVDCGTANGTAIAGSDYNAVSGKLTFARGETTKSILVRSEGTTDTTTITTTISNYRPACGGSYFARRTACVLLSGGLRWPLLRLASAHFVEDQLYDEISSFTPTAVACRIATSVC